MTARRAKAAASAVVHALVGEKPDGRWPTRLLLAEYIRRSGLFDSYAYAAGARLDGLSEGSLIRHYLAHSPLAPGSPQPLFEADRYRALADLDAGADAFLHFAVHGHRLPEGLRDGFNSIAYRQENPDLRRAGWDPIRHYLEHGWREGRLAVPGIPQEIPDFTGLAVRAAPKLSGGLTDVVIPVYRGRAETLVTIHSVLTAKVAADFRLVVIDDASPEPDLSQDLVALERRGLVFRIANPANRGFTVTANRGLALSPDRDVVLLNSDTEVFDGWLDRLRAHAQGSPNVGTVTPLSNAATILSYPVHLRDNGAPLELPWSEVAALAADMTPESVEIPTGVGFCLYMRRACLDAVGPFDESAFPRGYGEENDFCRRAAALGWRHLAAVDTFVKHVGSTSFGDERAGLVSRALKSLEARHPGYEALVAQFVDSDPLAIWRLRLDLARIRRAGHSGRLVHGAADACQGDLVLRKVAGREARFHVHSPRAGNTPNLGEFNLTRERERVAQLFEGLGIAEIVVHQSALMGRAPTMALKDLAIARGLAFRED
jgi:GT2 family glycosyltransferase